MMALFKANAMNEGERDTQEQKRGGGGEGETRGGRNMYLFKGGKGDGKEEGEGGRDGCLKKTRRRRR